MNSNVEELTVSGHTRSFMHVTSNSLEEKVELYSFDGNGEATITLSSIEVTLLIAALANAVARVNLDKEEEI